MAHDLRVARLLMVGLLATGCFTDDGDDDDESGDLRPTAPRDAAADGPLTTETAPGDATWVEVADTPADSPLMDARDGGAADAGTVNADASAWQPDGRPYDLRPRCLSGEVDRFASTQTFQNAIAGRWWPCGGDFTKNWAGMPVELTADGKWYLLEPTTGLVRRTGPNTSGVYRLRPWPTNADGTLSAFDADFFSEPNETNNVYAPMTVTKEPRQLQIGDLMYVRVMSAP